MVNPEVLDAMLDAGCTAEQIVAVVKAACAAQDVITTNRRAKDAERKRRQRHKESHNVTRTEADNLDAPPPLCPPDKEIPPKPPKEINPPISPQPLRRASRLPADFEPLPGFAESEGLTPSQAQSELAKFRDYWNAKAGKDAAKLDWQGTWRNWVRSAVERLPKGQTARAGPQGKPRTIAEASARLVAQMREAENANTQSRPDGELFEQNVRYLAAPER